MARPTTATLCKSSPRYQDWMRIFRTDTIQIVSPIPQRANLPGKPASVIYHLDTAALDADQRRRLVEHIARKFNLSEDLVWRDLNSEHGCPILHEDIIVSFDARLL